jgi:hypothetical protein
MIFPSLRSPLERTPPTIDLKRLMRLTYLRILQVQRPQQNTRSPIESREDTEKGQARHAVRPAVR